MTEQLQAALESAIDKAFQTKMRPELDWVQPPFGDFATSVALKLSPVLSRPPREIATKIAESLDRTGIKSVEIAGPGFINITMDNDFWSKGLASIDTNFATSNIGEGKKVQVEFISANPTGPTTFGNARGGYLGDVISRVLSSQGFNLTKEYYFNNSGTQIKKLVQSVKNAAGLEKTEDIQYSGEYIKQIAAEQKDNLKDSTTEQAGYILTELILDRYIRPAVAKMGIEFDVWFNEADLTGDFESMVEAFRKLELVYEAEGALWLKTTELGDTRDRALRKSNGDITYLGNDLSYHINIFQQRHFDRAIKIWGADHAGQKPSLQLSISRLFPDKLLDFVIIQWVRLIKDGQEVKISKRSGTYVTIEEVVDEVSSDVARFFFLMRSADSAIDFDLNLAKEQSQKNPLYYVMYSYARANSILQQAQNIGLTATNAPINPTAEELALIKAMMQLPELLAACVEDYGVHRLTFFGIELAKHFHDYYESERIIGLPEEVAGSKLYLIQRYILFMKIYFRLLGITPKEKM